MIGLPTLKYLNDVAVAQRHIKENPPKDIDNDYLIRQEALNKYLKEKYGNVS